MHPPNQPEPLASVTRRPGSAPWAEVSTPQGHGTYLIGMDRDDVIVLAPPGVRLRTEEGVVQPLCSEGWRLATFSPRAGEPPLVDQHRPRTLYDVGVEGAIVEILARCPEQLGWLADRVEEMVRSAWMISQPDINGDVPELAARRVRERDEMLDELAEALERLALALPPQVDERLRDPYAMTELRDALDAATPPWRPRPATGHLPRS